VSDKQPSFSEDAVEGSLAWYCLKCVNMIKEAATGAVPIMHTPSRPLSHLLLEGLLNALQPGTASFHTQWAQKGILSGPRDDFIKEMNNSNDVLELLLQDLRSALQSPQSGDGPPEMQVLSRRANAQHLNSHCCCAPLLV